MFCCYIFYSNFLNSKFLSVHLHGANFSANEIVSLMRGNLTHGIEKNDCTKQKFHLSRVPLTRRCSTYQKFHLIGVPLVESQLYDIFDKKHQKDNLSLRFPNLLVNRTKTERVAFL